ncbi:adenylosuccinate synthetase [Actinoplanes sp. SE50]|uniref:adenylosuccinate synthetase n=1 Tax=unclassified Actinoplanes TaxID=2626549 RepID=UPI00023EC6C1|nr:MULTISPECIES: adenylosuccinate synthetase [unclassified Actinoplanes]AEV87596.1 adenylosuccinate synthase [Actinoplanes sp. SE50/110]ATO85999.1 adenylosuccinate synthetase [Actinoplanes sp. SE50]SLM03413.1 adenylosuccinate synthetase [Actinoplanes sp. SE50/110]
MEHVAVVDLGYGDAGKGTVVDALCRSGRVRAVLRFNGGAQAAHNVVTDDGRHHTFSQFGAGTLRGVPTHLTRFMLVDPLALAAEAGALGNPFELLTVDGDALLTTPWHRAANRRRERAERHGSCGMGVGETMAYALAEPDAPRVADVLHPARLRRRLAKVREAYGFGDAPLDDVADAFTAFGRAVRITHESHTMRLLAEGPCVFEGAQGVLLDEWRGWHPHTTWSTTTFANVAELCPSFRRLGVVRTYTTRHGAGPFVTEDPLLDLPEAHNGTDEWQGAFRAGHFDAVAHRYAVEVAGGIDELAVTHLDVPAREPALKICTSYVVDGERVDRIVPGPHRDLAHQAGLTAWLGRARPADLHRPPDWAREIGALLGAPVTLESYGPRAGDKRMVPEGVARPVRIRRAAYC